MDNRFHTAVRNREERDAIVLQWQWLPRWVIGQHAKSDTIRILGNDDAESIGFLALLRAAELWSEDKGVLFKTYAIKSIWNRMRRECQERGYFVHMPTYRWKHGGQPMRRATGREGEEYPVEPQAPPAYDDDLDRELAAAIRFLPAQDRAVIHLLFWEGLRGCEIARRMRLSKQRVNKIKTKALGRLRNLLKAV